MTLCADPEAIIHGPMCPAYFAEQVLPGEPGYYAIYLDSAASLPDLKLVLDSEPKLLYVGIATQSLQDRLVAQDLRHRNPASFFRSLGAILGYRPGLAPFPWTGSCLNVHGLGVQ